MNGSGCHSRRHSSIFRFILVSQPFFLVPGKSLVPAMRTQVCFPLSPLKIPNERGITWTHHSRRFIFFPYRNIPYMDKFLSIWDWNYPLPSNRQNLILQDTSTETTFMVLAETTGQCQCFALCAPETGRGCCLWAKPVSVPTTELVSPKGLYLVGKIVMVWILRCFQECWGFKHFIPSIP